MMWLTSAPIAHRGYHEPKKAVFENTMPAFEAAIAAGFAIECDVRLTRDGIPVIFHDDDLERLAGRRDTIEVLTAEVTDTIAIGGSDATIPRLSALLDVTAGKVPLVVELKRGAAPDPRFVPAVLDAIAGYDGPLALMSFDFGLLAELKAAGATVPLGLTAEGAENFDEHEAAMALGLDFVSYYYQHLPNDFTTGLRDKGIPVITWTIRDAEAREISNRHGDQMTFEGFDPRSA